MHRFAAFFILSICAATGTVSCNRPAERGKANILWLSYAQTACFGNCPVYSLQVYTNGQVNLNGEAFMDKLGTYTLELTKKEMKGLKQVFSEMDFCYLDELYGVGVADLPSIVVVADCSGTSKRLEAILDYPAEVQSFAEHMRALAAREDWEPVKPANSD